MAAVKSIREAVGLPNGRIGLLKEVFPSLFLEPFHDLADVLRTVARANEQRVSRFDDHQFADANRGHELGRAPQKISLRIKRVALPREDVLTISREQFIDGRPGTDVTPADFRGNHENA